MSLVRAALSQLAESVSYGILGINRSCWGASTSGATGLPGSISGLRLLRSLAGAGDDRAALPFSSRATAAAPSPFFSSPASGTPTAPTPLAAPLASLLRPPAVALPPALGPHVVTRGYKSNKSSLKPLNTAASWQAVQPLLAEQRQRAAVEGASPPGADGGGQQQQPGRRRWRPRRLGPIVDTCLPPIPAVPQPAEYKRVGVIAGQYSLEPERTFAVVELAGSQYKVTADDVLFVNQLRGVAVNDVLALERVLLLGSRAETVVGRPYVPGGLVLAAVEEHFRDGKVHVFKKRRRKRYRKYQAPRPHLTTLRILQVRGIDPAPGDQSARLPELPLAQLDARYEGRLRLAGAGEEQQQQQQQEEGQEQRQAAV